MMAEDCWLSVERWELWLPGLACILDSHGHDCTLPTNSHPANKTKTTPFRSIVSIRQLVYLSPFGGGKGLSNKVETLERHALTYPSTSSFQKELSPGLALVWTIAASRIRSSEDRKAAISG